MKHILFICCMLPAVVFAQTKADYVHTMNKFVKFYNNNQADSIVNMWPAEDRDNLKNMWSEQNITAMTKQYGEIKSCKYLGVNIDDPNKVTVFTIQTSKAGQKNTSLTLNKKKELGTFRFITSSEGITKLLKRAK